MFHRLFFHKAYENLHALIGLPPQQPAISTDVMTKILLTGTMRCDAHEVDAVVSLMAKHERLSLAEAGCLSFELWQDELDPRIFHVSEVFRSERDFEIHQDRTHSSDWGRVTRHMPRDFIKSPA
ncbi:MAG: quinol monooxygenase YgiN [Celeribacter sp.]|jgi:quinol monooxygenase YgiN